MKPHILILIIPLLLYPGFCYAGSDGQQEERTLRDAIRELETATGYRFLYRDALLSGKSTDHHFGVNWQQDLLQLLEQMELSARINSERKQVVIYRRHRSAADQSKAQSRTLEGLVMDDQTGEQIPFATILWQCGNGDRSGTQADHRGTFRIRLDPEEELQIRISHIGYTSQTITVSFDQSRELDKLPVRLQPTSFEAAEIVITGSTIPGAADSVYRGLMDIGSFNPLGESNTVRMLHSLPSVSQGASLTDGAFIRGSNSDALQILLDGSVIYNHSHLFGLVDSFNADAIRTSSFHYDITPARFQGPPGGTLSLITRTGSLLDIRGSTGISNSVLRGRLEGPLSKGNASLLISGRGSILNHINWFNTDEMIAWGLDIDRKNSLDENIATLDDRVVTPGAFDVGFYDLHGKIYFETSGNSQWMVSGYSGANNTFQTAERITRTTSNQIGRRFETGDFDTKNRWGNHLGAVSYFSKISNDFTAEFQGSLSYYHTRFFKEDFSYQRPRQDSLDQLIFISDFENESELTHWHFSADLEYTGLIQFGSALNIYRSSYLENSLNRSQFYQRSTPLLAEIYAESEWKTDSVHLKTGGRLHYYSDGDYLKFSPRVRATFLPGSRLSFGAGYSRNYQFLYRLSFYNQTTSDIWITATDEQPPSSTDQVTGGMYLHLWVGAFLQMEGFYKRQRNLRFHEINIQSIQSPFEDRPWFFDNQGFNRGLEFMFRQSFRWLDVTQSYTFSKTELQNERLNNGERFYADWDRRHQFSSTLSVRPLQDLNVNLNWVYATGVPDRLDLFRVQNERLGSLSRVDLSARYSYQFSSDQRISFQAGVYNLLNRKNPWYRDWVLAIEERLLLDRLRPVQANVYDLGFQPSFSVSFYF